jgi:hypothetical protein
LHHASEAAPLSLYGVSNLVRIGSVTRKAKIGHKKKRKQKSYNALKTKFDVFSGGLESSSRVLIGLLKKRGSEIMNPNPKD